MKITLSNFDPRFPGIKVTTAFGSSLTQKFKDATMNVEKTHQNTAVETLEINL